MLKHNELGTKYADGLSLSPDFLTILKIATPSLCRETFSN